MHVDWVGQGCSTRSSAEGLNLNPCTPHEGRGARGTVAIILTRSSNGSRTSPFRKLLSLFCAPFLCRFCLSLRYAFLSAPGPIFFTVTKQSALPRSLTESRWNHE
jgi:hypothetical protein